MSKGWITCLREELKESPLYSNGIISFLMVGLEKLVEMDFACPCTVQWMNRFFSAAYFVSPAMFSSALMFCIYSPECKSKPLPSIASCIIPAVVWILLLIFDGQYIACAQTSWEGLTVHTDISAATTWCEPYTSLTNITEKQVDFFTFRYISQLVALGLLLLISIFLFGFGLYRCCCKASENKEPKAGDVELEDAGQSSSTPHERSSLVRDECDISEDL